MIAGVPNKSKQIDKTAISKRSSWKSFFGGSEVDSEIEIELIPNSKLK